MRDVHWTDYEWVASSRGSGLLSGACVSVWTDARVDAIIGRLPGVQQVNTVDFDTLYSRAVDVFGETHDLGAQAGFMQHGDCVLMMEPNGALGSSLEFVSPLADGGDVVAIRISALGDADFTWFSHSAVKTSFEIPSSVFRQGSDPDAALPLMRGTGGFWLYDGDLETYEPGIPPPDAHVNEASFALCEAITGAELPLELLTESIYTVPVIQ